MADNEIKTVEESLVRKLWKNYLEIPFAVIGLVASIAGIITFTSWIFFESKAISASHKQAVLARDGIAFNAKPFLNPDLSDWKKIVEVSVLIWNSGSQPIEPKDVRREVSIVVDPSSKIINTQAGLQKSNKPDDYKFQQSGENSYK